MAIKAYLVGNQELLSKASNGFGRKFTFVDDVLLNRAPFLTDHGKRSHHALRPVVQLSVSTYKTY